MKKSSKTIAFTLLTVLSLGFAMTTFGSCTKKDTLTTQEIEDLKYLREEEKLARDVYLYSYDLYQEAIFENISTSEQKHMNKLLGLLNQYNIDDPASTVRGVFNNQELQSLYNTLIAKADSSLLDALIVGATIEDVDIYDIDEFVARTSKNNIIRIYEKLECGSNNHMRAFTGELTALDYIYTPQYISLSEYNVILSAESGGCGGK